MLHEMHTIDARRSVLVLVDYQTRLMPAIHDGARVLAEAVLLADVAHDLQLRVLGTEQNPAGLGPNDPEVARRCDTMLAKMHFDACADGLEGAIGLRADGTRPDVVIAGCEAHVCLLQTTLGLLARGHRTWVVASACGSRRASDHAAAMQRLQAAGATLVTTEMVLFEWLHGCEHPAFRTVLRRIKEHDRRQADATRSAA
jgi:nicotinamidase-related amidase